MERKSDLVEEQKPGTGVDRTLIHRLLAISVAERVRMLAVEARNLEALLQRIRK